MAKIKKYLWQAVGRGRFRTTLHSKVYLYICTICGGYLSQFCACAEGRNVQPIAIKFGIKFSLNANKNWLIFGDFSPKGV